MTKDEIAEMKAGPEMDVLVAETVMGWRLEPHEFGHHLPGGPFKALGYAGKAHLQSMPAFSRDIAAAWEVVESFNRREWDVYISSDTQDDGKVWGISFIRYTNKPIGPIQLGAASDESLPLVICRAAITAVLDKR